MTRQLQVKFGVGFLVLVVMTSCGDASECVDVTEGTPWTPSVTGASSSNKSGDVSVSQSIQSKSASVIGYNQAFTGSNDVTFSVSIPDMGPNGSVTFVAEVENYPSSLIGEAEPMLVSVVTPASDGNRDWINLNDDGGSNDCSIYGLFDCSGASCELNSQCVPQTPSAYKSQDQWVQHQVNSFDYISVNTFPSCDFPSNPTACAFNNDFFTAEELPVGTYQVSFRLVSLFYQSLSGRSATVRLTTILKTDTSAVAGSDNGAIDLNIVITGNDNIRESRTAKGKQNLNSIFQHVYDHYSQSGTGVKIGTINAIEWTCDEDGDLYQDIPASELGALFLDGSERMVSAVSEGSALNIFFVSTITSDGSSSILGVAGGIGGPPIHGTGASGVAVATFDLMDDFNPDCDGSSAQCAVADQEADFYDLGATVSHELGHYLGLNHLTEGNGTDQDFVEDTPECELASGDTVLEYDGCRKGGMACLTSCPGYSPSGTFCPAVADCAYNHVMWWRAKYFNETSDIGDGNLFSEESSTRINSSPLVQ